MDNPYDMPASEYHAIEALSASGIKQLLRSPAHYKAWRTEQKEASAAMQFGTAFHTMLMEPHKAADQIVIMPEDAPNKQSKAGKEWHAEFAQNAKDKIVLSTEQRDSATRMLESIAQHKSAASLLSAQIETASMLIEPTLLWREQGVSCKARLDGLHGDYKYIIDLKTCADASFDGFQRAVWNFRYDIQAAWYLNACLMSLDSQPHSFVWIAVETQPPYGVAVYRADSSLISRATYDIERIIGLYGKCIESGQWECYSQEIQPLVLPRYARIINNME